MLQSLQATGRIGKRTNYSIPQEHPGTHKKVPLGPGLRRLIRQEAFELALDQMDVDPETGAGGRRH